MYQYIDKLMYYIQNINNLLWYFWYMTPWNGWCKKLHMKVPQSMIYLKGLPIWQIFYTIKYSVIHYNIELVSYRSCTSMYHLGC
jgi:hypothetical protein